MKCPSDPLSREDHEDKGQGEVQGAVLQVPLHPRGHRQGEGRQAEAILTTRCIGTYEDSGVAHKLSLLVCAIWLCFCCEFLCALFSLTLPDLAVKELGKSAKK